jgi:trehalose synthase-fused probable maltokinase
VVRADLEADASALVTPEWLTAQRWYGANDRHLAGLQLTDAAALPMEGSTLTGWLLVAEAGFAMGSPVRYLVPAVADGSESLREPQDGDGIWQALATAIADGRVLTGESGSFRCEAAPAVGDLLPGGARSIAAMAEHRLGVEQSNTSVQLGDGLLLKLYRRVEAGENPELEVAAFLESVGCPVVPRIAGVMRYLGPDGAAAAAMLQERIFARFDAWRQLGKMLAGEDGGPESAINAVREIGQVTAELHRGLAARPQDLAFPLRPATAIEIRSWRDGAMNQLDQARYALEGENRETLDRLAGGIRNRIEAVFTAAGQASVMRVHGDYHLGQLLVADDGYRVIDFEGEPARPLGERRAPQPPERDVAGMLRSLDYAARTAQRGRHAPGFESELWVATARRAFLAGYTEHAPVKSNRSLLAGLEIEKACYEVRYEAANRPDWVWLPLEALARAAAGRSW